jgi:hypothetical protein
VRKGSADFVLMKKGKYDMPLYWIIDRLALVTAIGSSSTLLLLQQPEASIAALTIWPLTRGIISVVDVFFVFFTDQPLVRASERRETLSNRTPQQIAD